MIPAGQPHRDMSGLERLVDDGDQVALHGAELDGPPRLPGEGGQDLLGVLASPVEPAVYHVPHPAAQAG